MSVERLARNRGIRALAVKIALLGGRKGVSTFVSGWTPYCDNPITIDRRVARSTCDALLIEGVKIRDQVTAMEVSAQVPCRKCEKCLQYRQMKWRERAILECARAKRTWFVTLTFAPIHLAGVLMEASSADTRNVERAAYRHVQLFFKRLRQYFHNKADVFRDEKGKIIRREKAEFRYLAIYERGEKNDRSHYHLLLHETGTRPILKELLEKQWRSFVHARLVGGDEANWRASYITKYATKSFSIRPRASAGYGKIHSPDRG